MSIPKTRTYNSQPAVTDFGLMFSGIKYSATLAALANNILVVPSCAVTFKMVVKSDVPLWISNGTTAESPVAASFTETESELINPNTDFCRHVVRGDEINFISDANANVSVVFYIVGAI